MVKVYIDPLTSEELLEANRQLNNNIEDAVYFFGSRTSNREVLIITSDTQGIRETENNKIIGLCNVTEDGYRAAAHSLYIYEEHRRKGYGKAFVKLALKNNFNYTSINKSRITVYSGNKASIKLHKSLGFKVEAILKDYIKINNKLQDAGYYILFKKDYESEL